MRFSRPFTSLVPLLVAAVLAGCSGGQGQAASAAPSSQPSVAPSAQSSPASSDEPSAAPSGEPRTIAVSATDALRFEPPVLTVKAGETVRFVVSNTGTVEHEFYVGDAAAQDIHEQEMAAGAMHHGDANGVDVKPGATATLEMTFDTPGELLVGCHVAGHYAAGMRAILTVEP